VRLGAEVAIVAANQQVPAITSGAAASWLSETAECPETTVTFGTLNLVPRRCSASLRVSSQLLKQSPELAEKALRRDLLGAVGQAIDVGALSGVGNAEPVGLLFNSSIIATTTFGGAATLAKLAEVEQALGDSFGEGESPAWVTSPSARSKLRQKEGISGGGRPLWSDENKILGRDAHATAAVADHKIVFGNFSDFLIVFFGKVQLISDPYSEDKSGIHGFVVNALADCGPLRNNSFARSTDSAAQ
jgi:HK97 family phage major capsid protein